MINDPQAFFQQVMALLVIKSPRIAAFLFNQTENSENELAALLADRIAALIEDKATDEIIDVGGTVEAPESSEYEAMANRNRMLASALGACDCWGDNEDCPVCEGQGQPGWTLPERKPFDYFVQPMLRMVRESRHARSGYPQRESGIR